MLEVDKRRDDEERNENPISDGDLPRERSPDGEKKKRSEQFDRKITKRNLRSAFRAAAAQNKPTEKRQILIPGDRCLAGRDKMNGAAD